jgi:hypothetical protein
LRQEDEIIEFLENFGHKYNTPISKYIQRNFNSIDVCSTDVTLNGKVKLVNGSYPVNNSSNYISTSAYNYDKKQVGMFRYFDNGKEIVIHPFESLKNNSGFEGLFYLQTTDMRIVNRFIDDFGERFGKADINSVIRINGTIDALIDIAQSSLSLTIIVAMCFIFLIFIALRHAVAQSKANAVLRISGYNLLKIMKYHIIGLSKIAFVSFSLNTAFIFCFLVRVNNVYYFSIFLLCNAVAHIAILFIFVISMLFFVNLQNKFYKQNELIKGRKPFTFITYSQLVLKYAFMMLALISLANMQVLQNKVKEQVSNNSVWKSAENFYTISANFITNDMKAKRILELRAYEFYKDFVRELKGILIDAKNYQSIDGLPAYKMNANSEFGKYSIYGMSILVNENYLTRHLVVDSDGQPISDKIIKDPYTINLLVPVSLRSEEQQVYKSALESFYFKKVSIANLYHREFNESLEKTSVDNLRANIIYVKDGNSYFTYDSSISPETNNQVLDPIVYIDTQNFDPSEYYSYLTRCCVFETNAESPIDLISPIARKHNMSSSYSLVFSIYDERAAEISTLQEKLDELAMINAALVLILIFSIYMFTACYCEHHKFSMYIKRILGFGLVRIAFGAISINLILTSTSLVLFPLPILIKVGILLFDTAIGILFLRSVWRNTFRSIAHGGA